MLVGVATAIWVLVTAEDDSSARAAGVGLILSPALYLLLAVVLFLAARALAALDRLSRRSLFVAAAAASLAVATTMALARPLDLRDALITFTVFGVLSFALLALAVTAWWHFAEVPPMETGPRA